jgi:capsular exopolysaccharide synthesis family protein
VALAQTGQSVVVVSADLRRPTLEKYFSVNDHVGLSTWLLRQARKAAGGDAPDVRDYVRPTMVENLFVLPTGPIPPNPAELLAAPSLAGVIRQLEERFNIVLIDTAPTLPVADASILASHVGGVIVVIDASTTARSAGEHVRDQLTRVGANIIGTVMNRFVSAGSYSYYGTKGYGAPETGSKKTHPSSGQQAASTSGKGAVEAGSKRGRRSRSRR